MLYFELAVAFILVLLNGVLAMAEFAIVSSRRTRLTSLVERNAKGASRALALATNPGRFLSTIQIGITLIGILSGAFSGATLGLRLTAWLVAAGLKETAAEPLGVGIVVIAIAYLSLIIGELVPKQIALRNPENVALRIASAMTYLQKGAYPLVMLLEMSANALLRLMGQHETEGERLTDEEIRTVIAEAERAGVLKFDEHRMISGVMRLGDRSVRGVMTPRADIDWINLTEEDANIRNLLISTKHSRLPAGERIDDVTSVVQARELLADALTGKALDVRSCMRPAPVLYDKADALKALSVLRSADVPMALVYDEHGSFEGIVTPADILEAVTGAFQADLEEREPAAIRRDDGSWLLAGDLPADEMADTLGIELPETRDYQTTAGFLLSNAHRLPKTGEAFLAHGWRFEVVDMDELRIDKVLATRRPPMRREGGVDPESETGIKG